MNWQTVVKVVGVVAGAAAFLSWLFGTDDKKRVFVTYDYKNDRQYKQLLLAWDANAKFVFGKADLMLQGD